MQGREKYELLFPREMRLPTDTPGKGGWDYGWVFVPEEKSKAKINFRVRKDEGVKVETGAPGGEGAEGGETKTAL